MPKFMKMLNNISRSQSYYRASHLREEGICAAHHTFILAICRLSGCTQEELAREICLNKSTVTRTLAHLEGIGLVRREVNIKDKRSSRVYPTEKMLSLLPIVRNISSEWNTLISQNIPEHELNVFYSVLSRMEQKAKSLTANREDN